MTYKSYDINIKDMPELADFNSPAYFELNGQVAKIEKMADGNIHVNVPEHMSIADFMQDGTIITKETYDKLVLNPPRLKSENQRVAAKRKAVA